MMSALSKPLYWTRIEPGSKLSYAYGLVATLLSVVAITVLMALLILLLDGGLDDGNPENLFGELFGFIFLGTLIFGVPLSVVGGGFVKFYQRTFLRTSGLTVRSTVLIAAGLGFICGLLISATSSGFLFAGIGGIGGAFAGALFFRFETGHWL